MVQAVIPAANLVQAPPVPARSQIVIGLIPCQNRYYLDLIWPIVKPGVVELANSTMGEWSDFKIWSEICGSPRQ